VFNGNGLELRDNQDLAAPTGPNVSAQAIGQGSAGHSCALKGCDKTHAKLTPEGSLKLERRALVYASFMVIVSGLLLARTSAGDNVPFDYAALSSQFSGLLVSLGGFSITVLALILGLDALDSGRGSIPDSAHVCTVRHVGISLAIACIASFMGSSMFSEITAQSSALEARKEAYRSQIDLALTGAGLDDREAARMQLAMFDPVAKVNLNTLRETLRAKNDSIGWVDSAERVLNSSMRRHFMLASIPGFASSILILQSLAILLLIRFPNSQRVAGIHVLAVLSFSALLFIKLLHTYSRGMDPGAYYTGRFAVIALLVGIVVVYSRSLRASVQNLKPEEVEGYTPIGTYYFVLATTVISMFVMAATFNNFQEPSLTDWLIASGSVGATMGLLLVMQLEQPTIELLKRSMKPLV